MTLARTFRPAAPTVAAFYDVALVIGGSMFIALSAQASLLTPFSPVPVTGQTLAVLLVGMLFGSRLGVATLLAYMTEGLLGLPVFSGASAGLILLAGPTGGYLVGFVAAVWIVGSLADRGWGISPTKAAAAMALGSIAIYAAGAAWLSLFVGPAAALSLGVAPFLVGDALKIALGATALPILSRLIRR